MPASKTLIIQNLQGIGDYMWFVRHIHAIAKSTPEQKVSLLTRPRSFADQLAKADPLIDEVIWLSIKPGVHDGLGGLWKLAQTLRKKGFERAYILHSRSLRYALVCRMAGIPHVYGPGVGLQKLFLSDLTRCLLRKDQGQHPILRATALIKNHGLSLDKESSLPLPKQNQKEAADLLKGHKGPFVGLCIGSSEAHKKWPEEHFVALAKEIYHKKKCTILILGGPSEIAEGKTIASKLLSAGVPSLFITGDLLTTLSVLARCTFLVGNDTGVTHAAPLLGVQALVLLGQAQVPIHQFAPLEGIQYKPPGQPLEAHFLGDTKNEIHKLTPNQVVWSLAHLKWV